MRLPEEPLRLDEVKEGDLFYTDVSHSGFWSTRTLMRRGKHLSRSDIVCLDEATGNMRNLPVWKMVIPYAIGQLDVLSTPVDE